MELSLSHCSSLGISAVNPHYKAVCCPPKAIPSKLNARRFDSSLKCFKYGVSVGLYNRSSCSTYVPARNYKRNSIWACSQVGAAGSDPMLNKVSTFRDVCWRFLRPHTIRGTALGSVALVGRALIENSNLIKWSLLLKAFSGLIALICGNGYIVGINQIYDIGIDKVNKPYLPVAAGDLSVQSAWFLVIFFAVTGLLIVGYNFGPFITSLYSLGLFLGTIYSVPLFRMKRFPVAAFLIIATVRGFLLNFGVYCATRVSLRLPFQWRLPSRVLSRLNSIMENFLWGDLNGRRRVHWVNWQSVCNPKELGGLGIIDLNLMNRALLGKCYWRFAIESRP